MDNGSGKKSAVGSGAFSRPSFPKSPPFAARPRVPMPLCFEIWRLITVELELRRRVGGFDGDRSGSGELAKLANGPLSLFVARCVAAERGMGLKKGATATTMKKPLSPPLPLLSASASLSPLPPPPPSKLLFHSKTRATPKKQQNTPTAALDRPVLRVQSRPRLGVVFFGQGRRRSRRRVFLFQQARGRRRPPRRRRRRFGLRQVLCQPDPAARGGGDQGGVGEGE